MPSCPTNSELAALLDDRLDAGRRAALEAHVGECAGCQEALLNLSGPTVSLRDLTDPLSGVAPPASLLAKLRHVAATEAHAGRGSHDLSAIMESLPAALQVEVLGELGRGGTSVVFKVRQVPLDRIAALKLVPLRSLDATSLQRNRRGAESLARLAHPGIVQIFEVGRHDATAYGLLEFMEGGSLKLLLREGPLPSDRAARLVADIADAVQFIHQQGIIHRDLKSSNILLTKDGAPKVADFGLAKRLDGDDDLTRTGDVLGTPAYMAPEQAVPGIEPLAATADIYSLGIILYELLVGRPPFHGATALDTLYQVVHLPPMPPSQRVVSVPRDLETICLKCLRKEPEHRYTTAQELADDLRRFLRGEPIRARPVGSLERVGKWMRRQPRQATAVIGIFSLLAASVAGLLIERSDLRRAARDSALLRQSDAAALLGVESDLYHTRLQLARRQIASGDRVAARQTLLACDPSRRDAEWQTLWRQID